MTTESDSPLDPATCAHCGRESKRLFPRDSVGQVCTSCYETLARQRPEWGRLEVLGAFALIFGSALLVVALMAVVALAISD